MDAAQCRGVNLSLIKRFETWKEESAFKSYEKLISAPLASKSTTTAPDGFVERHSKQSKRERETVSLYLYGSIND